jgi:hypothetical protein
MRIIEWFLNLTLPWRILLSAMMVFLGGPALIGFLSEYATYWYAINRGVRPPVEGIPYLSATVTFASLSIVLAVSIAFYLSRIIVRYFIGNVVVSFDGYIKLPSMVLKMLKRLISFESKSLDRTINQVDGITDKIRSVSPKSIIILSIVISLIVFGLTYWRFSVIEDAKALEGAIAISVYSIALILSLWRQVVMQFIAFVSVVFFYVFSVSLLFNQDYYSEFLKVTGFGGGQVVFINLKDKSDPLEMELILRSKDWFIGFSASGENLEIPKEAVESVKYNRDLSFVH